MGHPIDDLFDNPAMVGKIKRRLPNLFQLAEIECTRNGKIGQEVGAVREKILIALLIYHFGNAVQNNVEPTRYDIDVILKDRPISIKTITSKSGNSYTGIKVVWTADNDRAQEFVRNFHPNTDLILTTIRWGGTGGLYYITQEAQTAAFALLGKASYLKQLAIGTNNRGVEYSREAIDTLITNAYKSILIDWKKEDLKYNTFEKWLEYWKLN